MPEITPRKQPAPSFGHAELAWFRGTEPSRREDESPPQTIYVGYAARRGSARAWWQSLLDELD